MQVVQAKVTNIADVTTFVAPHVIPYSVTSSLMAFSATFCASPHFLLEELGIRIQRKSAGLQAHIDSIAHELDSGIAGEAQAMGRSLHFPGPGVPVLFRVTPFA
jgi:hypothetical protein